MPAPLVYVFFKYARRWLNHHHALIAVDNDQIILADQNARQRRAKHSRNAQATRDDCGMRCASTPFRDETAKGLRCTGSELEHVSCVCTPQWKRAFLPALSEAVRPPVGNPPCVHANIHSQCHRSNGRISPAVQPMPIPRYSGARGSV